MVTHKLILISSICNTLYGEELTRSLLKCSRALTETKIVGLLNNGQNTEKMHSNQTRCFFSLKD